MQPGVAVQAAGRASFNSDTPKTADLHRSMLNPFGVFSYLPVAVRHSRPPPLYGPTLVALARALALTLTPTLSYP